MSSNLMMWRGPVPWSTVDMDTDAPLTDPIALSAQPPLLADCLRILLEPDLEVVVIDDAPTRRYGVALWTPGAAPVEADVVVRLDHLATEGHDCAAVIGDQGEVVSRLRGLDDVVAFVEDHAVRPGQ